MFINKTEDGKNHLCGRNVARFRTEMGISQRKRADRMQLVGLAGVLRKTVIELLRE